MVTNARNGFGFREQDSDSSIYSSVLFEGTVNLIVSSPIDIACHLQLLRFLKNIEHLHILGTAGSFHEGSVLLVNLYVSEPLPLFNILTDIPGIKDVQVFTGDELSFLDPLDSLAFELGDVNEQILLSFGDY